MTQDELKRKYSLAWSLVTNGSRKEGDVLAASILVLADVISEKLTRDDMIVTGQVLADYVGKKKKYSRF